MQDGARFDNFKKSIIKPAAAGYLRVGIANFAALIIMKIFMRI